MSKHPKQGVSAIERGAIFRAVLDRPQCDTAALIEALVVACRQAIVALKGREHDGFLRDAIELATGVDSCDGMKRLQIEWDECLRGDCAELASLKDSYSQLSAEVVRLRSALLDRP